MMASRYFDNSTNNGYIALYLAIIWYRELTVEEAFRMIEYKYKVKPECKEITNSMLAAIDKIVRNKDFKRTNKAMDRLERRFKADRYRIFEELSRYRKNHVI